MYEEYNALTSLISIFIYTILALSCFRFLGFNSNTSETSLQEDLRRQKDLEIKLLKAELEKIQSEYQDKFADAIRGELKK